MNVRRIAPWSLGFALCTIASAQTEAILSHRDDAAFARKLFEKGHADMAVVVCDLLEKSGKLSGEAEVGVKALKIDLEIDLARNEPDLYKRKDQISLALQSKEEFIRQYAGTREAEEAAVTLPDVYRQLGLTILQLIQNETEQAVLADLQAEGQRHYSTAEDALGTQIARLEEQLENNPEDERVKTARMWARFNLGRTKYYRALLLPPEEWKRKELLDEAVSVLDEFTLDYSDVLLNYDALILIGQCLKEKGEPEEALRALDDAIRLRTLFNETGEVDPKTGKFPLLPQAALDVVSEATLQKMLFLHELKLFDRELATGKEYFKVLEEPESARRGLAILAQQGEAQLALGDNAGTEATANRLRELDENGPWGAYGDHLLNKIFGTGGADLAAGVVLKVARTVLQRGNEERALQLARQAASQAGKEEPQIGFDAWMLVGSVFYGRGLLFEAAMAFDHAAATYPAVPDAAEAVYQSMQTFFRLKDETKDASLKKEIDERLKALATRYGNHPRAAYAQIAEGQGYESDGDYVKAAETYLKVQPSAASYHDAQFRAGYAYYREANRLSKEGKAADAKGYFTQAETLLKKASTDSESQAQQTLDLEQKRRHRERALNSRIALAQLYLDEGRAEPRKALEALEDTDSAERFGPGPNDVARIWNMRIQAYGTLGQLDEAVRLLDALMKKEPNSSAIGPAARLVGIELDQRATKAQQAGKTAEAEEDWKRAASYYAASGRAELRSTASRLGDVGSLADRLFAIGLILNRVPEQQLTFVAWPGRNAVQDTALWRQAADLYAAALRQSPSVKNQTNLAKVLGYLGDWVPAADAYADLFESESAFRNLQDGRIDAQAARRKPELVLCFIEWAATEHGAAVATNAADRFARARDLFSTLAKSNDVVRLDSTLWWIYTLEQIRTLMDQGDYKEASLVLRNAERNTPMLGAPAGDKSQLDLTAEFKAIKSELDKKTFSAAPPTAPTLPADPRGPR